MTTPRYLIAKHIPDLGRMEPRNVGVVVWSPDGVEARFVAEKADRPGEVVLRHVPSFVADRHAYRQWVAFWRAELAKPGIVPLRGRDAIAPASPGYLDALMETGRGHFVLADGGFLLDPVERGSLPRLADQLFASLVGTGQERPRDPTLDQLCDALIQEAGLAGDANFRTKHVVTCPVAPGTEERYEFSHAYQNGSLQRLYQRVPFPPKKSALRKTVHDAAWMFDKVVRAGLIVQADGVALVSTTPEQRAEPDIERLLRVIGSVARVVDMNDRAQARLEFRSLAELASH